MAAYYTIRIADVAVRHLRALKPFERTTVLSASHDQLCSQPTVQTKNRKLLLPNPLATWELRVGRFRVFYPETMRAKLNEFILAARR